MSARDNYLFAQRQFKALGAPLKAKPLDLHPTQFVLGLREVDNKIAKIRDLKDNKLADWLDEHEVPCVIGPKGGLYLIDHHHFAQACAQSGINKLSVKILADQRELSMTDFWQYMKDNHWLYLYDQFGNGPHEPRYLPLDLRGMADDPFRSLAWELRNAGLIAKNQQPFSEFKWAAFLRERIAVDFHDVPYEAVVAQALALAKAAIASGEAPKT